MKKKHKIPKGQLSMTCIRIPIVPNLKQSINMQGFDSGLVLIVENDLIC